MKLLLVLFIYFLTSSVWAIQSARCPSQIKLAYTYFRINEFQSENLPPLIQEEIHYLKRLGDLIYYLYLTEAKSDSCIYQDDESEDVGILYTEDNQDLLKITHYTDSGEILFLNHVKTYGPSGIKYSSSKAKIYTTIAINDQYYTLELGYARIQ